MLTHYTQREVTTTWVLVLATTAELEDKHHLLGSLMRDLTRKHKEHKDNAYYSICRYRHKHAYTDNGKPKIKALV